MVYLPHIRINENYMENVEIPPTGGWLTEDFKWLVLDAYVDLAERIINEGYMDGSEKAQEIADDMLSFNSMIDGDREITDRIGIFFGEMEVPGADIETSTQYIIESIEEYREKRKKATK